MYLFGAQASAASPSKSPRTSASAMRSAQISTHGVVKAGVTHPAKKKSTLYSDFVYQIYWGPVYSQKLLF
jgi:hypothetical protein